MGKRRVGCRFASGLWHAFSCCTVMWLAAAAGCGGGVSSPAGIGMSDDLDVVTVVRAVYELTGGDCDVLFVELEGYSAEALEAAVLQLGQQLPAEVLRADQANLADPNQPALTPVHPETGEIGILVQVFAVEQTGPDKASAHVAFSRSGLSGADLVLTFERVAEGWELTDKEQTAVG